MKKSFVFLAEGFEEIEALTVVDVLRRASIPVFTVSIDDTPIVTGAHGISVQVDSLYTQTDFSDADWLIIPGGMPGSTNLSNFDPLNDLLRSHAADGGNIAAICAAPAVVLYPLGILRGRDATCYPGFEKQCKEANMHDSPVIIDKNIITANGPSSDMRFALSIVQAACGEAKSQEVGSGMLYYPKSMNFYF